MSKKGTQQGEIKISYPTINLFPIPFLVCLIENAEWNFFSTNIQRPALQKRKTCSYKWFRKDLFEKLKLLIIYAKGVNIHKKNKGPLNNGHSQFPHYSVVSSALQWGIAIVLKWRKEDLMANQIFISRKCLCSRYVRHVGPSPAHWLQQDLTLCQPASSPP